MLTLNLILISEYPCFFPPPNFLTNLVLLLVSAHQAADPYSTTATKWEEYGLACAASYETAAHATSEGKASLLKESAICSLQHTPAVRSLCTQV